MMILSVSCSEDLPEETIARVGDELLTQSELNRVIPATVSREDSIKRAKVFVNGWVRKQVILRQAEFDLDRNDPQFQEKAQEYLNDLLIYEYEAAYVLQNLDTTVTRQEALAYYDEVKENFIIDEPLVRVRYAIYEVSTEGLNEVAKKWKRYNELDSMDVAIFSDTHAKKYYDKTSNWIPVSRLLAEIPLSFGNDVEAYLRGTDFADVEKNGERIILGISEYRSSGDVAPFGHMYESVRRNVLNSRKMTLLENLRTDLFKEAIRSGDIEIIGE